MNISNVGWHLFGMVKPEGVLSLLWFLCSGHLGKKMGGKVGMEVAFEMTVEVVRQVF